MPFVLGVSIALFATVTPVAATAAPELASPEATLRPAIAVIPVTEPGRPVPPELIAAAHALRSTLRERSAEILSSAEMKLRLSGGGAGLVELERAYAGAQAAYQADELDSAVRILRSVVADLERAPERAGAYDLWLRSQLRLAQVERSRARGAEAAQAMERILALEPDYHVDPDQFAPSFRRDFEEARRRFGQVPRAELTIRSRGREVIAHVGGKEVGSTPVTVSLPAGRYRIVGVLPAPASGAASQTPPSTVALADQPVTADVDVALAEAVLVDPPSVQAPADRRGATLVALGAWLRADQVVAIERALDDRRAIAATLYDVSRERLVREARAPLVAGSVRAESVDALSTFLSTGERSSARVDLATEVAPPAAPARWLRPAAYLSGAAALGLGAIAVLAARTSHDRTGAAAAMVRSDGTLRPGADRAGYDAAVADGTSAMRSAYVAGAGAVVVAITSALLGYRSLDTRAAPVLVPAVRF